MVSKNQRYDNNKIQVMIFSDLVGNRVRNFKFMHDFCHIPTFNILLLNERYLLVEFALFNMSF